MSEYCWIALVVLVVSISFLSVSFMKISYFHGETATCMRIANPHASSTYFTKYHSTAQIIPISQSITYSAIISPWAFPTHTTVDCITQLWIMGPYSPSTARYQLINETGRTRSMRLFPSKNYPQVAEGSWSQLVYIHSTMALEIFEFEVAEGTSKVCRQHMKRKWKSIYCLTSNCVIRLRE